MNRLVHSDRAYLRALQISEHKFFAFVEGGLDRSYYDRILERMLKGRKVSYQVIAAKELPSATGGKPSLLNYFKNLRKKGSLIGSNFGKKFVCAFFADKDVDDLARKRLRSDHLIYTSTYDLEGHLLSCGDLTRAIADSCGLTREQARIFIGPQQTFLRVFVENWKDWTVLCIISQVYKINCGCTFDRASQINFSINGDVDKVALGAFQDQLQLKLGLDRCAFEQIFSKYRKIVDQAIHRGQPLKYFKGKWFISGLQDRVADRMTVPDASRNGIGEKVMIALISQVTADLDTCRCSTEIKASVNSLIRHIELSGAEVQVRKTEKS